MMYVNRLAFADRKIIEIRLFATNIPEKIIAAKETKNNVFLNVSVLKVLFLITNNKDIMNNIKKNPKP